MSRMSAKYIANKVGKSTTWVYELWETMELVTKDKFGDWALTEFGRSVGGKMSKGNYLSVPVFDFETIIKLMMDFYNRNFDQLKGGLK